jgi:c-di-GMP-binding flagellar brake protein YcgR
MADVGQEKGAKERRQVDRWHLVFYLRVFDGMNQKILGHLVDISEKGIMLICDNPVAVNKAYSLRMCLPNQMKDRDEINFPALSRWCKSDTDPTFYLAGFQLDDLEPAIRNLIATLIRNFRQND